MLKKRLFTTPFFFFFTLFLVSCSLQEPSQEDRWENHAAKIFQAFKAKLTAESSLEEMNAFAQANFLRPRGYERLAPETISHYKALVEGRLTQEEQDIIYKVFEDLGELKDVYPLIKKADYVLIMGSTVESMRARIMFFNRLVAEGKITLQPTTQIVFLSGDRPLLPSENATVLTSSTFNPLREGWIAPEALPENEVDLAPFLWKQLELTPVLLSYEPVYVNAPKKDGTHRATTADTVEAFARNHRPTPGHVLIISENPFVRYQGLVTETLFLQKNLKAFTFESVGPMHRVKDVPLYIRLGGLLDNFARTLYQRIALKKAEKAKV
ncbi:MAG TPA: hypothetical protein DD412_02770 [Holosporales bacterium]|nr:hypothetical protein [Holosporales bacterium]